jgi:hypothetical protein
MIRRTALLVSLLAIASVWAFAPGAEAQGGGGCQLKGTASFKPGLTATPGNFTYSFGGSLTGCMSNESNAPGAGTVSAGQVLTFSGEKFQEPVPTGSGACEAGQTKGISITKWSTGAYTVIKYETNSVTGAVELDGKVVPSVTLKAIHPKPGQPRSKTIKTTLYSGGGSIGVLTFSPKPDPTACGSTGGVTSAGINGFVGVGSAS